MSYCQAKYDEKLIFEYDNFEMKIEPNEAPEKLRRKKICLPLLTEQEVFRHYLRLSQMSFGVDSGFYP
ncbi:MAG: aminomethyl-transferring glycine dehydrogenase subunit GcvPB, partial [Candidatus Thermoplasmatota archaeon]